jgi:hypothetical protein
MACLLACNDGFRCPKFGMMWCIRAKGRLVRCLILDAFMDAKCTQSRAQTTYSKHDCRLMSKLGRHAPLLPLSSDLVAGAHQGASFKSV